MREREEGGTSERKVWPGANQASGYMYSIYVMNMYVPSRGKAPTWAEEEENERGGGAGEEEEEEERKE